MSGPDHAGRNQGVSDDAVDRLAHIRNRLDELLHETLDLATELPSGTAEGSEARSRLDEALVDLRRAVGDTEAALRDL